MSHFFWRAVVTLATVAMVSSGPGIAPGAAHSGGKAVVLVADLTLTPAVETWTASITLVDGDSGSPIRGVDATLTTGSPPKSVPLEQGSSPGNYTASLGPLTTGPVHLELRARTLPGAEPIVAYDNGWDVTLVSGQSVKVASETSSAEGANLSLIAGVGVVALLTVAGLFGLTSRRRRVLARLSRGRGVERSPHARYETEQSNPRDP